MSNTNFLQSFVEDVLRESGYEINESVKNDLLPQFVVEAERRLGLAAVPHLSEDATKKLMDLVGGGRATPEELWNFWQTNIPDFEQVIKTALNDYAVEIKNTLQSVKR